MRRRPCKVVPPAGHQPYERLRWGGQYEARCGPPWRPVPSAFRPARSPDFVGSREAVAPRAPSPPVAGTAPVVALSALGVRGRVSGTRLVSHPSLVECRLAIARQRRRETSTAPRPAWWAVSLPPRVPRSTRRISRTRCRWATAGVSPDRCGGRGAELQRALALLDRDRKLGRHHWRHRASAGKRLNSQPRSSLTRSYRFAGQILVGDRPEPRQTDAPLAPLD